MMKGKTLELRDDRIIQTKHLRKEKQENHNTGGVNFGRKKTHN